MGMSIFGILVDPFVMGSGLPRTSAPAFSLLGAVPFAAVQAAFATPCCEFSSVETTTMELCA